MKSPVAEARNEFEESESQYTYSVSGQKLKVVQKWNPNYSTTPVIGSTVNTASLTQIKTTDYVGNKVYENGVIRRILVDGGYIEGNTDHLGNNRVVAKADGTLVQKTHYYPFGSSFAVATGAEKQPCTLISTDESGSVLIPKGGTGLGILSETSEWVDRSELVAVKDNGKPANLIPSSYNTIVELKDKLTVEEFLDYSITDFYELENADNALIKAIDKDIYTFTYSYLDNYEGSAAFLLVADNVLYMLIGTANNFEMLCFGDCGRMDDEDEDTFQIEDDDNLDFSMLNFK